jgi:hypothetical protein
MTSNAVPPSVTPPSPNEWPQDLVKPITGITRDSRARITCVGHGFTSASAGITFVMVKQVLGMLQINGTNGLIQEVVDADNFTVNINSTAFNTYASGGVIIVDSGLPPSQEVGFQIFNTPFQNVANDL